MTCDVIIRFARAYSTTDRQLLTGAAPASKLPPGGPNNAFLLEQMMKQTRTMCISNDKDKSKYQYFIVIARQQYRTRRRHHPTASNELWSMRSSCERDYNESSLYMRKNQHIIQKKSRERAYSKLVEKQLRSVRISRSLLGGWMAVIESTKESSPIKPSLLSMTS